MSKFNGLSIYSMTSAEPRDCLEDIDSLAAYEVDTNHGSVGKLYLASPVSRVPDWWTTIKPFMTPVPADMDTRRSKAVWLIPWGATSYAIPFGDGRHLLKKLRISPNFGLKSVLNTVDPESIASLKKRTLDSTVPHARHQAVSRDTDIDEFGIDVTRDLLRGISGKPLDSEKWGGSIEGGDAVRLYKSIGVDEIPQILSDLDTLRASVSYRASFPWVDHIQQVRDDATVLRLEQRLSAVLADRGSKESFERCFLALPDTSSVTEEARYRVSGNPSTVDDLTFDVLATLFGGSTPFDGPFLRRKNLMAVSSSGEVLEEWKLFECLYFETKLDDAKYILVDRAWYRVDLTFEESINASVRAIPLCQRQFAPYAHASETAYNAAVAGDASGDLALFDSRANHIWIGGGHSSIEFCDLYSLSKQMIFVKRFKNNSQPLSHLLFQVITSTRLLRGDANFRKAVEAKMPGGFSLGCVDDLDPSSFEVVVAIVTVDDDVTAEKLPFFARISLHGAYQRVRREMGFPTTIAWIRKAVPVHVVAPPAGAPP